jgi:hypothetical protein
MLHLVKRDRNLPILLGLFAALFGHSAQASEAYDYASTAIDSLAEVRDATDKPIDSKTDSGDDATISDELRAVILMKSQIKHAEIALESYKNGSDKNFSEGAGLLIASFELLNENLDIQAASMEKFLNDPISGSKHIGSTKREIYEIQANMGQAYKVLYKSTALSAITLEDFDRLVDGKTRYLRITEAERENLKKQLIKRFGQSSDKPFVDHADNTFLGKLYWDFLTSNRGSDRH